MKPLLGTPLEAGTPLSKGLVGAWLFNEGSGVPSNAIINDPATNFNNMGDSNWIPGQVGGVLTFNGSDEAVVVKTPTQMNVSSGTIIARVRVNVSGSNDFWFGHNDSGNRIYLFSDSLTFFTRLGSTDQQTTGKSFTLGEWATIAISWDGTDGYAYFQGDLVDTYAYSGLSSLNANIAFGSFGHSLGGFYWYGDGDYTYIYDHKLSDREIYDITIDPFQMWPTPKIPFFDYVPVVVSGNPWYYYANQN